MYLYFFHVFVEPFAAVLFFGSGFAPRLFIPSSQCDRSTERRYWYWTCIENKDGAIIRTRLIFYTHMTYIIYIYRYKCLYSIWLSHIPTSIYLLPHETLQFFSTSPTTHNTTLKAESLPEVMSEIEDQGPHWGCAQWRWTWKFVDQQDIRWSLHGIFLKRFIPVS